MNGDTMGRVFFYAPHPDDETLSAGLALIYYIAAGFDVHLVSMTLGDALGVANTLNGAANGTPLVCSTPSDHPYIHNPVREGYAPLTVEDIGVARTAEARSALGAMAMIPPNTGVTPGQVFHHVVGLHDGFGAPGQGSSTAPVTREGIDAAKAAMLPFIQDYPNSFHYTMSPADHHHDHAACGIALREIKAENPTLLGAPRFFVSRLYWASSQPDGHYQQDLLDEAAGTLAWFNYAGANYDRYVAWLKNQVQKAYRHWNPAAGAYGIGYHQVTSQFASNLGPSVVVGNLWHG
jgi:LmbE family N-acetylglucosaminyl deacetylase